MSNCINLSIHLQYTIPFHPFSIIHFLLHNISIYAYSITLVFNQSLSLSLPFLFLSLYHRFLLLSLYPSFCVSFALSLSLIISYSFSLSFFSFSLLECLYLSLFLILSNYQIDLFLTLKNLVFSLKYNINYHKRVVK